MRAIATRAALALGGLALALLLWSMVTRHYVDAGVAQERARWQAAELVQQRQADADYAENTRLSHRAAEAALASERTERTFADQLTQERSHASLVYQPPLHSRPGAHPDGPAADRDQHLDPRLGDASGNAGAPAALAAPGTVASPHLSADAVRLWNAALAGPGGAAALAAGACGADAAAADACAADSGLTLDDAWDNQATNALACRIDRGRYGQLIELLRAREAQAEVPFLTNRN